MLCLLISLPINRHMNYMTPRKLFYRRELKRYQNALLYPGVIDGWFGNRISLFAISPMNGVVQSNSWHMGNVKRKKLLIYHKTPYDSRNGFATI